VSGPADPAGGRVRIPADVDRPDTLLAGLTARQLAVLAAAAVVLWAGYVATRAVLPLPVFAGIGAPLAGAAVAVALGRRDGLGADRLLAAALRQARRPRRMVLAPDGVGPAPVWAGQVSELPAPLVLPLAGIGPDGVIDLGGDGAALICRASAVTFALRTPAEQRGLVAGFGRWLNSLEAPVQILVRAIPLDLTAAVGVLRDGAPGLPHPGLEAAAIDHARFLAELATSSQLLTQQVLLVLRLPRAVSSGAVDPAVGLARRAEEATAALAAAGVTLTVLDGPAAAACLAGCFDPAAGGRPAGLAAPTAVITAGPDRVPC